MIVLSTLFLPLSSFLMEIGKPRRISRFATFLKMSFDLLTSPAVYPIILGFCWRATGWALPLAVHTFVDLFAKAAPHVVGGLCWWAGFTDAALAVPMITAGLPTGANAFLLARGSTSHATVSATTVMVATGFSLFTVSLLILWLTARY